MLKQPLWKKKTVIKHTFANLVEQG